MAAPDVQHSHAGGQPHAGGHGHAHAHAGYGPHHVAPASAFVKVLSVLLILTVITVAAAQVDFGAANLLIAMLIASIKASLVMAIFMHLKWDTAINRIVFLGSFLFFALLVTFTLADQLTRGRDEPIHRIKAPVNLQWQHPAKLHPPSNQ